MTTSIAPASGRAMGNPPGFTLVELVVVLLVLSVILAAALPAFLEPHDPDPRTDGDIARATQRIEALFRLARDSAVRGGADVSIHIDSATNRVWLDVAGAPPDTMRRTVTTGSARLGRIRDRVGEDLELPAGVRMQLSKVRATFTFRPTGAAFGDTLMLAAPSSSRLILLHPWTGDVLVY